MAGGKVKVGIAVDWPDWHHLRRMVERTLCRNEHFAHQVLPGTSENKLVSSKELYAAPEHGLDALLRISGNLLELIEGDNRAEFPGFKIVEHSGQRRFGRRCRHVKRICLRAKSVNGHGRAEALQEPRRHSHDLVKRSLEGRKDPGRERPDELGKILCPEHVHIRAFVLTIFAKAMEYIFHKSALAHAPRRDKRDIAVVADGGNERSRLLLAVAEVFRAVISRHKKWILRLHDGYNIKFHPLRKVRNALYATPLLDHIVATSAT